MRGLVTAGVWIRRECWSWATTKERRCRSISRLIASPPNWGIFLCHLRKIQAPLTTAEE